MFRCTLWKILIENNINYIKNPDVSIIELANEVMRNGINMKKVKSALRRQQKEKNR